MFRKLLVLGLGGVLTTSPLAVSQAQAPSSGGKAPGTFGVQGAPAYGVQGAPAYGVQGAPAYGVQGAPAYGFQGYPMWGVQGAPAYGFQGYPMWGVQGAPAYGFQGYPMWGVQGAPAYGAMVWIPAVVGATAGAGATPAASGAPQPVLCMVEPTDTAVIAQANIPDGQKIAVIANTETACRAIKGTVTNQAAGGAPGAT